VRFHVTPSHLFYGLSGVSFSPESPSKSTNNDEDTMANIWRDAVPTSTVLRSSPTSECERYFVPAGTLVFYDAVEQQTVTIAIESAGAYIPDCSSNALNDEIPDALIDSSKPFQEPFYGSVIPIAYTISATTLVAWLLFILLLIAQKKRPWFQTFMTLFVATSLTVFLAKTTRVLENQYDMGYHDAEELRHSIFGSMAFRVLEVLSVLIVWMAHLQVLLRMFKRSKERLIIKWAGVILAVIDCTFWCLTNFLVPYHTDNYLIRDIIPVLAYLFQITIQVVYAGAVLIYSIRKRKFAYHRKSLITAFISIAAVLMPLIFFILDLAEYWITGWSEFIRWVSDAAASVVVWEWIDLIEKLEREEQKNGVLGRQIYEENDIDLRGKSKMSTTNIDTGNGSDGDAPGEGGVSSGMDSTDNTGHMISKRYNRRNFFSLFSQGVGNTWVVSRASSAASASTSYGGEIRLSTLGSSSRPTPTTNNDISSRPVTISPIHPNQHYHQPPQQQYQHHHQLQNFPQHAPGLSPTPEGMVAPPAGEGTPPVLPMVRHIHPMRRSMKRPAPSHGSSSVPSTPTGMTNRTDPMDATIAVTTVGPSSAENTEAPGASGSRNSNNSHSLPATSNDNDPRNDNDHDDDDDDEYTLLRSGTVDAPPSFEPIPGFSVGDYWDDKQR
jgi:hypothetical protein